MRSFVLLAFCLTAAFAAPQFEDLNHYAQHQQSVAAARRGASARLEDFGTSAVAGPADDLCGLCEASRTSHSSGSDIHSSQGGGFVVPIAGGSSGSTSSTSEFSSTSSSDSSGPVVIPVVGGGESSSSTFHETSSSQNNDFAQTPVTIPVVGGGGSDSFSSHTENHVESVDTPQVVHQVYPAGGGSESSYRHTEKIVQSGGSAPVATIVHYPSGGGSESSYHRSEKVVQSAAAPVPVITYPSGGSSSRYSQSSFSERQEAAAPTIVTYPSHGGSSFSSHHESDRFQSGGSSAPVFARVPLYPSTGSSGRFVSSQYTQSAQQPSPIVVPISTGGRSVHTESRFGQLQSFPTAPSFSVYPSGGGGGGGSLHHSSYQQTHSNIAAAPTVVYTAPSGSSSQSHLSEHYTSSAAAPQTIVAPVFPAGGSSSRYFSHSDHSSNQGLSGGVVPLAFPSGGSSSSRFSDASSTNSHFGGALTAFPAGFDSSAQHFSARFGDESHASSGLAQYMTESERLARLQSQNIHSSSGYKASSTVDLGANSAYTAPSSSNYGRTKSWEKSSKWASQSEYDETGTTRSNGFLTTAEGEDETVNGKSSGYKAATTTVENDGKRSTYSIHTP